MEKGNGKDLITVMTTINAPIEKVWNLWTDPKHIIRWNHASDDWHTTKAENDLKPGGKFMARMEAKDGSFGFDFSGIYENVVQHRQIEYLLDDGRKVKISFDSDENTTTVTETFEAEQTNPLELQQNGWQAILDNFKKHVESSGKFDIMQFAIIIDTNVEKVFHTMLDIENWSRWTAVFDPTSTFVGSWEEGSKILFLATGSDGTSGGMVSRIKEFIPSRLVRIEHLGVVQNGEEITSGDEALKWAGATENYIFTAMDGKTRLFVDMDITPEFTSYFSGTWPEALKVLKTICEE
jgi:uncharacterized protein YndB with AHSA1/START domain